MFGRIYMSSMEQIAVTLIQDVFEITVPSTSYVILLSCTLGQHTDFGDAAAEMLPVNITRYATGGSAGSLATPRPQQVGHGASAVVVDRNNTTQGATPTVVHSDTFNVQAGWQYRPLPEEMLGIPRLGSSPSSCRWLLRTPSL